MPFLPDSLINRLQKIRDNGYKDRTGLCCIRTTRKWDNDCNVFRQRKKRLRKIPLDRTLFPERFAIG